MFVLHYRSLVTPTLACKHLSFLVLLLVNLVPVGAYFHKSDPQLKVSGLRRYEQGFSNSFHVEFILAEFQDSERRNSVSGKLCGNSSITSCSRPEFFVTLDS